MKQIILTKGLFAIVDDEDFDRINAHKWYAEKRGKIFYARTTILRKNIYMHRFILEANSGKEVDHRNGNGLDNQKTNLRECDGSHNKYNTSSHVDSNSKYKGVCWDISRSKWMAYINAGKKRRYLGRYNSELEAAKSYNCAAIMLHGDFARLNLV